MHLVLIAYELVEQIPQDEYSVLGDIVDDLCLFGTEGHTKQLPNKSIRNVAKQWVDLYKVVDLMSQVLINEQKLRTVFCLMFCHLIC